MQGVGFRPYVHRLARELHLTGIVRNMIGGVWIEAEGTSTSLLSLIGCLRDQAPQGARIDRVAVSSLPLVGDHLFRIEPSEMRNAAMGLDGNIGENIQEGDAVTSVPKDLAPCSSCLEELRDPYNRRYRYPFITCNMCGPRYTIAERLPFDRQHTAMSQFTMCTLCMMEFTSLENRRYHAQTISCPDCGPKLTWRTKDEVIEGDPGLLRAVQALRNEGVIALKGVGGFQLVCLARASSAVDHIRTIKERPMKPLAVMAPHLEAVREVCLVDDFAASLLTGAAAPIVLLERKRRESDPAISRYVAPMTNLLGVMLASSPLHQLLLDELQDWLVVSSANRSGAPTDILEDAVLTSVGHMIAGILTHNRAIAHLADDSVVRLAYSQGDSPVSEPSSIVLRPGRGLAPVEVFDFGKSQEPTLALGAHGKATFAFRVGQKVVMSPYIGDWDHEETSPVFEREIATLTSLYGVTPIDAGSPYSLVCDAHPEYGSTIFAVRHDAHAKKIPHHAAHLEAIIKETEFSGRGLGVIWDGTGLGEDGTIWGGEFFAVDGSDRRRVASIRPIPLWGGEKAIRDPRRIALGLLWEIWRNDVEEIPFWQEATSDREKAYLPKAFALQSGISLTSSIGRLFDGIAALFHLDGPSYYEAQAAMALEQLADSGEKGASIAISWEEDENGIFRWDWRPLVRLATACETKEEQARFAALFHATLASVIVDLAERLAFTRVLLSGGVFQNACLSQLTAKACKNHHIDCLQHRLTSPGDAGIALGQIGGVERLM